MNKTHLQLRVFSSVALLLLVLMRRTEASKDIPLYLLTQLPWPERNPGGLLPSWTGGINIVPALDLAVEDINNCSDLLPNHRLVLEHVNGGCDFEEVNVENFAIGIADHLYEEPPRYIIGGIGPGCSRSTNATAVLTHDHRPELELVSIQGAGAHTFHDRVTYSNMFGILGSNRGFGVLSLALMRKTGWRKIAILFHDVRLYYSSMKIEAVDVITSNLPDSEIVFTSMVTLDTFLPLASLRESRARIIFVFTPPPHSLQIMCLALRMGMVYPAYQWVLASRSLEDFGDVSFSYNGEPYNCSEEELHNIALDRAIFMNYRIIPLDSNETASTTGESYDEYWKRYSNAVDEYNNDTTNLYVPLNTTIWSAYMYDAVWAWAYALDGVTKINNLTSYKYGDSNITELIRNEMYKVNFTGHSGPINFAEDTGFLHREIDLAQITKEEEITVAIGNNGSIIKLQDIISISDEFETSNSSAIKVARAIFGITACLLLLAVTVSHILTILYRDHKSVKASSPKLNHIAFVGNYLLVVGLLLLVIVEDNSLSKRAKGILCQTIWAWVLPISFSLTLGPVVVRTWRLYRIFTHYLDPGPLISNPVLIGFILILVSIDILVAIVWTAVDPLMIVVLESTIDEGFSTSLVLHLACRADHYFIWLGIVMSLKFGTLLIMGVLALVTRNINNQSFTTASLRVFCYIMTILFSLGFGSYYIVTFSQSNNSLDFSILALVLDSMLLAFIACVYMPPLLPVIKEKLKIVDYNIGKMKMKDVSDRKISVDSSTFYL